MWQAIYVREGHYSIVNSDGVNVAAANTLRAADYIARAANRARRRFYGDDTTVTVEPAAARRGERVDTWA